MHLITKNGIRVHDSIRQHGGPETAKRVLVFGHIAIDSSDGFRNDLFHADDEDVKDLILALQNFLTMNVIKGGGARRTFGDDAMDDLTKNINLEKGK